MDEPQDKASVLKLTLGIIAAVYAFIVLPGVVAYLAITGKLDLSFASDILRYIGDLTNSPAGQFIWDNEGAPHDSFDRY